MSKTKVTAALILSASFSGSTIAAVNEAASWQDHHVACCEDKTWISEYLNNDASIFPEMDDINLYTNHR